LLLSKQRQLTSPKTYQIFAGPHDEIYKAGNLCWWEWMLAPFIAICKKRLNPETKTPGIYLLEAMEQG